VKFPGWSSLMFHNTIATYTNKILQAGGSGYGQHTGNDQGLFHAFLDLYQTEF
jgi:hypothetical protein